MFSTFSSFNQIEGRHCLVRISIIIKTIMIIEIIINNLKPNIYRFNHIFLIKSEYYVSGVKIKDNTLRGLDSPPSKCKI